MSTKDNSTNHLVVNELISEVERRKKKIATKPITVRLDEDLYIPLLEKLQEKTGQSLTEVIKESIVCYTREVFKTP